jgi:spoIIIJ-associated protein
VDRKYSVEALAPKIDNFLRPMLASAGFELTFKVVQGHSANPEIENPEVVVNFSGEDVDLLLRNRGELLLAVEHIAMEALRIPSEDHSLISFDANDYRVLRIEELRASATAAAERVKHSGSPFRFNPMNSRERRVIHLALRGEDTLRSESAGAGGYRHVIIYPAGMPSLPEPPPPPPRPPQRPEDRGAARGDSRGNRDRGGSRGPRDRGRGPSRGRR